MFDLCTKLYYSWFLPLKMVFLINIVCLIPLKLLNLQKQTTMSKFERFHIGQLDVNFVNLKKQNILYVQFQKSKPMLQNTSNENMI